MKKIIFLSLALAICASSFSQFVFKGVGGGLSLGSQAAINSSLGSTMGFGINVNALAGIMDKIDAEANFTYFLPSEPVTGVKYSIMTINFNGHYNFFQQDKISAYGLAGLNLSMWKSEFSTPSTVIMGITIPGTSSSSSKTEVGLNIGAGGAYELTSTLDATAQLGYTIGNADQLFINLGVLYKF